MKSIIKDLEKIVSDLEYGDVTKNDVVSRIELAISEMIEHDLNN